MEYILIVEYDSTSETTCNVKALPATIQSNLENYFKAHNVKCNNQKNCFEVDVEGIRILNVLCESGYKVVSQSMAIDTTNIGGRSVKIQKTVWTLAKAL